MPSCHRRIPVARVGYKSQILRFDFLLASTISSCTLTFLYDNFLMVNRRRIQNRFFHHFDEAQLI